MKICKEFFKRWKEKRWEKQKQTLFLYDWLTEPNRYLCKGKRNEKIQEALTLGKSLSGVRMSYNFDDPFGGPIMEDGFSAPGAIFTKSHWWRVTWRNGNLSGAKFNGATIDSCELEGTRFCEADLSDVDFTGSDLSGVDFTCAKLDGVKFSDFPKKISLKEIPVHFTGAGRAGYYYRKPPIGLTDELFEQLEPWELPARWAISAGNPPRQKVYQGIVVNPGSQPHKGA